MTVQNTVGASDYGFYFAVFNFSLLFNILLDIGMTNFNNREIAQHNQLLGKYFSNIVSLKMLLGIAYGIALLASGLLIGYNSRHFHFLLFLGFNQFLLSFILYLRSNISGLHLFKTDSLISVLDRTILIIVCAILLWTDIAGPTFQIEWLVYAQTFAYAVTILVTFFIVQSKTRLLKINFDFTLFRMILKQSWPFALLVLLMSSYTRIDSVMLERMLPDGATESGIYAQGFRILDAVSNFALLFAGLLLPIFAKMIKDKENVASLVKVSFLMLIIPASALSLSSYFYSHDIMFFLYNSNINEASNVFGILIVGFIPISVSYIFGTLLTANGSLKLLNIMAACGVVANVGLNLILIPLFEAYGAAVASLATQSFTALVQIFLVKKVFKFRFNLKTMAAILIYFVVIFVAAWISQTYIENRILGFAIILLAGGIAGIAGKLIDIKALIGILKYGK